MILIKALMISLVGISLCIANISGIVTDTGSTPVAGAVVQLEKGGQTATTGADGTFTLFVSTAIIPSNNKALPDGLPVTLSGNLMTITIAERSSAEITTYDLNGKALTIVRKILNAGSHSLTLPYRGNGIYLYKVKACNREFVLKGNSVGGVLSGSTFSSKGSSSKPMRKQALTAAAINDVISATKAGYLNYRCVQYNYDTAGVQIKMIASPGTVSDTDGNVYQTVRIGTQVWTVENLRVTKYNDGSSITLGASSATWEADTAGKYCFYNNTTNSDSINRFGALYNWYIVNTGKLAPAGWHVPTNAEWDTLQNYLIAKGYNWDGTTVDNKIAKSLAAKTDWHTYLTTGTTGCDLTLNNSSGFSALPGGYRGTNGNFYNQGTYGYWWSATWGGSTGAGRHALSFGDDRLTGIYDDESCGFPVRLVKD